ncbi:MAG: aromatic amino acid transport family protein, partial [Chlamydiales bacterium]
MDIQPHKQGSLLGAILLIAGCCIGAGMLGLPVLSGMAGFKPSLLMFFICWLFMAATGILLLEVNLWYKEEIHIVSMAERTLGKFGKITSWLVFLFLFYSLMVAYIAASGSLVADFITDNFSLSMPHAIGSLIFSLLFGCLLYLG